eukprot:223286_1
MFTIHVAKYIYSLHAVVVHDGKTWKYGHYRAIAKSSDGSWYIYSDHRKPTPISARHVLKQQAMILLYCDKTITKTWNNTKPSPAIANNATSKRSGRRKKCRSKRSSSVHPSTPSNSSPSALGTANPSMAPNITTTTSGSGCPINTNKSQPTHPTPFTVKTTTNSPKSHPTPFTLAAKSSTITTPSKTTTNSPKSHPTPFTLAAKPSTITAPSKTINDSPKPHSNRFIFAANAAKSESGTECPSTPSVVTTNVRNVLTSPFTFAANSTKSTSGTVGPSKPMSTASGRSNSVTNTCVSNTYIDNDNDDSDISMDNNDIDLNLCSLSDGEAVDDFDSDDEYVDVRDSIFVNRPGLKWDHLSADTKTELSILCIKHRDWNILGDVSAMLHDPLIDAAHMLHLRHQRLPPIHLNRILLHSL